MKNILTGQTTRHLVLDQHSQLFMHPKAQAAFDKMREAARLQGFALEMTSAFRSFETQLNIWNLKARGLRTLYNDQGEPLDYSSLSPREILYSILRWSALPGASRHHWGTDIDVYDKSRLSDGYEVQLLPEETTPSGIFGELHLWLDDHLEDFHFFRPYSLDLGGIAPERWHLSYRPVSEIYQRALDFELIEETILKTDIELKDLILKELPEIYRRFINI